MPRPFHPRAHPASLTPRTPSFLARPCCTWACSSTARRCELGWPARRRRRCARASPTRSRCALPRSGPWSSSGARCSLPTTGRHRRWRSSSTFTCGTTPSPGAASWQRGPSTAHAPCTTSLPPLLFLCWRGVRHGMYRKGNLQLGKHCGRPGNHCFLLFGSGPAKQPRACGMLWQDRAALGLELERELVQLHARPPAIDPPKPMSAPRSHRAPARPPPRARTSALGSWLASMDIRSWSLVGRMG